MKKFLVVVAAVALVIGLGNVAYANYCSTDVVPAATILYPFVQYNYTDPNVNTLFSVTNVSSEAVIVHFTLWTDYSVHVVDWNVVLSGYDVQTFSIRDILDTPGQLPSTGTQAGDREYASPDQGDGVGPIPKTMPASESTSALSNVCNPNFEAYPSFGPFPQTFKNFMKDLLTFSQTTLRFHIDCNTHAVIYDDWFEARTTNDPTWMYITADVVYSCNKQFPDGGGNYWGDATGYDPATDNRGPAAIAAGEQALFDNVLIGDIYYLNRQQNFSEAINAVSLEANPQASDTIPTFYYAYSHGADHREPLPTGWAFRYANLGSTFSTQIRVFKRATNWGPTVYDMDYWKSSLGGELDLFGDGTEYMAAWDTVPYSLYFWNEDEDAVLWTNTTPPWSGVPSSCRINLFPLETQQVDIAQFGIQYDFGWGLIVFPPANGSDVDNYQTYVSTRQAAEGHYSAALQAAVIYNALCDPNDVMP